jgi:RNA polymerase sigma-70 factor (ECF subfamily)
MTDSVQNCLAIQNEAALLTALRAGDEAACAWLVRQHGPRMLAVARRMLRSAEDCADAVQDAFVAAFRYLDTFAGNSTLATWLHRIVVNTCLMKLRSQARSRTVPLDDLLPTFGEDGQHAEPGRPWTNDSYDLIVRDETRRRVHAGIDRLPEPYRAVLLLRDIEEFNTNQTAGVLGISPAAVKTRLHRARQALRRILEPVVLPA